MENSMIHVWLDSLRPWLPLQNPLHCFVHNNVLMSFEGLEFHQGVAEAASLYRARPYPTFNEFRSLWNSSQMTPAGLQRAIADELGRESLWLSRPNVPRDEMELLFQEILLNKLGVGSPSQSADSVQKHLEVKESLRSLKEDLRQRRVTPLETMSRQSTLWLEGYREPLSEWREEALVPALLSYLDQGIAMIGPRHQAGNFWKHWGEVLEGHVFVKGALWEDLRELYQAHHSVEELLEKSFGALSISDRDRLALELLFDLKGWSGMVNRLEKDSTTHLARKVPIRLMDWLGALVLVEKAFSRHMARQDSLEESDLWVPSGAATLDSEQRLEQALLAVLNSSFAGRLRVPQPDASLIQFVYELTDRFLLCAQIHFLDESILTTAPRGMADVFWFWDSEFCLVVEPSVLSSPIKKVFCTLSTRA